MKRIKLKTIQIRNWRKLKRHPVGAEYPDLVGPMAENMREGIKKYGVVNDRPVVIHGGLVLDGWQMYCACVEEDVKPRFVQLSKDISPEEYVQIVNNHRRHETPETALARIVERRKRVAEARQEGKSIRTIAEEENVSIGTVVNDLDVTGVQGRTPEPKGKVVKGKDGKEYPAQKPEPPVEREPGDDTEEIEREKEARKDRLKNGAVLWEPKEWHSSFGVLMRQIDKLGKAYGEKESPQAYGLRRKLDEFKDEFFKWHKAISKRK